MVGRDGIDRAIAQSGAYRGDVAIGAQRRIDLEHRVVAGAALVGEREVMGRRFGRHTQPSVLGRADHRDRTGRRQVLEVHAATGEAGQCDIPHHHELFGFGGLTGNAQFH